MRFSRSASWHFREADSQFLHVAIYARDAAGLHVPPSADMPPHLAGELPSYNGLAPVRQQILAGQQWRTWWDRLLRHVVSDATIHGTEDYANLDEMLETMRRDLEDVFDPPDFRALSDLPALRQVVASRFGPGLEWLNRRPGPEAHSATHGAFAWEAVRDAAEEAAAERGVPLSELKAVVHVLDVEDLWSYLLAPGCALCSSAMAASSDAAIPFLREVFASRNPPS
jgi:hypothetical protein